MSFHEEYITKNVWLIHDTQANIWYFEHRDPDNWAMSEDSYNTREEARVAWKSYKVEWIE